MGMAGWREGMEGMGAMRQVLSDAEAGRRAANDAEDLRKMLRGGASSFEAGVVEAMAEWLGPPSR